MPVASGYWIGFCRVGKFLGGHPNKEPWWQHRINSLYLIAKLDLMKLLGTELSLEQRKTLYSLSNKAILEARSTAQTHANLEIDLEDTTTRTMNLLIRLDRKLSYSIRWPNPARAVLRPEVTTSAVVAHNSGRSMQVGRFRIFRIFRNLSPTRRLAQWACYIARDVLERSFRVACTRFLAATHNGPPAATAHDGCPP